LEADDIAIEELPWNSAGMSAGEQARARAGARGPVPEFLHALMFGRIIEMPAESGSKIRVVSRGIGDQVVPQ